jgi:hypothetical protein
MVVERMVLGIDAGIPDGTWRANVKQVRSLLLTLILIDITGYLKAFEVFSLSTTYQK